MACTQRTKGERPCAWASGRITSAPIGRTRVGFTGTCDHLGQVIILVCCVLGDITGMLRERVDAVTYGPRTWLGAKSAGMSRAVSASGAH